MFCIFIIKSINQKFLIKKLVKNGEIIINQIIDLINKLKNLDKKINHNHCKYNSFSFNNNAVNDVQTEEFNDNLEKKCVGGRRCFYKCNDLLVDLVNEKKKKG